MKTFEEKCFDFLGTVNDEQLEELVNSTDLEVYPNEHIWRDFVEAVYGDRRKEFITHLSQLYVVLAKECYARMVSYRNNLFNTSMP